METTRSVTATIVLPCWNEEDHIAAALLSLIDDWVRDRAEVLVVDGGSSDRTGDEVDRVSRELRECHGRSPIRRLENPGRFQVFALNAGVAAARGEIIVRADAHCVFPGGYARRAVERLMEMEPQGVANVGGVMRPKGSSARQKAIARALSHPLGVGDALFHLGRRSGFVDTAYLGTFRKSFLEGIGLYDTSFQTNEDAELNLRILKAGKKIYLDHRLEVEYRPRETFSRLAQQYFRYGRGRARTMIKHKKLTSWRQILPPALVAGLAATISAGFFQPGLWLLGALYPAALAAGAIGISARSASRDGLGLKLGSAWAMAVMHVGWGTGFLLELARAPLRKRT